MSRPEWLTPGAHVSVISDGPGGLPYVKDTKVDRVMKRDVVLIDGDRFNADRLSRSSGSWGPTFHLVTQDDPRAIRVREKVLRVRVSRKVEACMRDWRDSGDIAHAHMAITLLREALGEP